MKKPDWNYVPLFAIFALSMALAPVFRAQDQGSLTRITPVPADAEYTVDGQTYTHASSALWPTGSKHVLWVPNSPQIGQVRIKYIFRGWEFDGGTITTNPVTITASPAIPEYRASFDVYYGLGLSFFGCPDPTHCQCSGHDPGEWQGRTVRRTMCTCRPAPQ